MREDLVIVENKMNYQIPFNKATNEMSHFHGKWTFAKQGEYFSVKPVEGESNE